MIKLPQATYIDAEISNYEGNPLINALPKINSNDDIFKLLFLKPTISAEEKTLPPHLRRHAMLGILDQFLYPTRQHLQLEQLISTQIRRSYLQRNILTSRHENILYKIGYDDLLQPTKTTNSSFVSSVIGCSGTGKSTAVEKILNSYPQALYHPDYFHTQLVWLKLDAPHDGSARSLCIHFFRAVDKVLATDYESMYVKNRSSADSMLSDIARVSAIHSLGILVLDELPPLEKFDVINFDDSIKNTFITNDYIKNFLH